MEYEEKPETFKDIARICVKKSEKGAFDELITSLYRIKQLTEFIPMMDKKWDNKTVLMKCIRQGLQCNHFEDFKAEVASYTSFADIAPCGTLKEFYNLLQNEESKEPLHVQLLRRFLGVLHDHEFALQFLGSWVKKDIDELEQKAEALKDSRV